MTPPSDQDEHATHREAVPRPGGGPRPAAASALHAVLPADWVAPSVARDRLDSWLRDLAWPGAQRDDLVLALSEAVSNSVEHGYGVRVDDGPPPDAVVDVRAELVVEPSGERRIVLAVRDDGTWREPTAERHRGHGLRVIRASGDDVVVDGGPHGTTVTLTSRPAPPVR